MRLLVVRCGCERKKKAQNLTERWFFLVIFFVWKLLLKSYRTSRNRLQIWFHQFDLALPSWSSQFNPTQFTSKDFKISNLKNGRTILQAWSTNLFSLHLWWQCTVPCTRASLQRLYDCKNQTSCWVVTKRECHALCVSFGFYLSLNGKGCGSVRSQIHVAFKFSDC